MSIHFSIIIIVNIPIIFNYLSLYIADKDELTQSIIFYFEGLSFLSLEAYLSIH
jgi:hypothetical protein